MADETLGRNPPWYGEQDPRSGGPGNEVAGSAQYHYDSGFYAANQSSGSSAFASPGHTAWETAYGSYDESIDPTRGERPPFQSASVDLAPGFRSQEADWYRRRDFGTGPHQGRGPKGYTRSDERICEDICDRLTEDGWVDASEIEVTVSAGEVTLVGIVDSRDVKRRTEDLIERVPGVLQVQNNLRVARAKSADNIATGLLEDTEPAAKPELSGSGVSPRENEEIAPSERGAAARTTRRRKSS